MPTELHLALDRAITEDWELVKDTAGKVGDARTVFDLAYRFGWHASDKYRRQLSKSKDPYKGPINRPCSACSAGDTKMEYHDHDYVPEDERRK